MTPTGDAGADQGGEAPCFAHLLDEPERASDEVVAERPGPSEGDRCPGLDVGSRHGGADADAEGDGSAAGCT